MPNLEFLLAGADVDVRPPDHQSLSRVGVAGNAPVSARLPTHTCQTFCFFWGFFCLNLLFDETHRFRVEIHLRGLPDRPQVRTLSGRGAAHATARGPFHPGAGGPVHEGRAHVHLVGVS